jgi:RNA polymerase sigma factor (sigma-70 family)
MSEGGDFPAFYQREFRLVFRAVFLSCGGVETAEDATQEAFARALVRWRRLGGQPWAAGWVTTTAMNVARRAMRRRAETPADRPSPEHEAEGDLDVRAAIRLLPARQQEAVALHYLLDLSVADTASAMSVDEGTVKTHLARARATLVQALRIKDDAPEEREPSTRSEDLAPTQPMEPGGSTQDA